MNKHLFIMVLVIGIFISPLVLADGLSINVLTSADKSNGSFYVSNNDIREIEVNIKYQSKDLENGKMILSLEVFPNLSEINVDLSNSEFFFYNDLDTTEKIYLKTKTLTENKNIRLKVEVFDKYNNPLETKTKYITIVPNNSDEYYNYTKDHTRPRLLGYNLSRSIAVINGKEDYDIISIFVTSEYDYSVLTECSSNNSAIIVNYNYINSKQTDLNLSIDKNATLDSGDYFLNCRIYDEYDLQELKEIKIRYTNKEEKQEIIQEIIPKAEKKITGFLSIPKIEMSRTFVLLAIFMILVILIIFAKSN